MRDPAGWAPRSDHMESQPAWSALWNLSAVARPRAGRRTIRPSRSCRGVVWIVTVPSLLAVFAPPDDESLSVGEVLARHATAGARTAVVTATWDVDTVRAGELAEALRILGAGEPRMLGYADARVPYSAPGNVRWCDVPDEAVRRLVMHIRLEVPVLRGRDSASDAPGGGRAVPPGGCRVPQPVGLASGRCVGDLPFHADLDVDLDVDLRELQGQEDAVEARTRGAGRSRRPTLDQGIQVPGGVCGFSGTDHRYESDAGPAVSFRALDGPGWAWRCPTSLPIRVGLQQLFDLRFQGSSLFVDGCERTGQGREAVPPGRPKGLNQSIPGIRPRRAHARGPASWPWASCSAARAGRPCATRRPPAWAAAR